MSFIQYDPLNNRFQVDDRKVSIASRLSTRWLVKAVWETRQFVSGSLLDIGCGKKPYAKMFSVTSHVGIDWPNSFHSSSEIDTFADAVNLPFKGEIFDTVLCTEVLEHIPEPRQAVLEMARVLKKDGHLILTVPFVHWIHESPFDFYRYTPFGLKELLHSAGLEMVKESTRGGELTVFIDIYARVVTGIMRRILKKLSVPSSWHRLALTFCVALPQHMAAPFLFFLHDLIPSLGRFLDSSDRLTLGYVIVARKRP